MVTVVNLAAGALRERLLQDGAIAEAESVLLKVAELQEDVRLYRERYEDILSVTSTWAPGGRNNYPPSNAGSRRSCSSQRITASETDMR